MLFTIGGQMNRNRFLRASEVGEYVFCARAWRMRLDGYAPTRGGAAREAGTAWHLRHGRQYARALKLRMIAHAAALGALLLLALIVLVWWWR
jgi:hypothetical protein